MMVVVGSLSSDFHSDFTYTISNTYLDPLTGTCVSSCSDVGLATPTTAGAPDPSGTCLCPSGTVMDNGECISCPDSCSTCTYDGSDFTCLTCMFSWQMLRADSAGCQPKVKNC